ncbi:MAG: hypothetical protein AABO41_28240 [Acidobacteriota bacterium]
MKKSTLMKFSAVIVAAVLAAATLLMPGVGFAQGRGHGRGQIKKTGKFVNGHDARDGRWDGRGPKPKWFKGKPKYRAHARHRRLLRRR